MLTVGSEAAVRNDLEGLVLDADALSKLDDALSEFNMFEAMGAVHSELKHSDFLGYLLNPRENHGLADTFLRRFLQRAVLEVSAPISALELGVWDLSDCVVEREAENIDLLIHSRACSLAVIVENKIRATEHSNQLERYERAVRKMFPQCKLLPIYLTVDGDRPSHPSYVTASYRAVCEIIEDILQSRALYPDVAVVLHHYASMVRRHLMDDSKLASLALAIYERHKKAIDYIIELRPDQKLVVADALRALVGGRQELILEKSSDTYIRFVHRDWPDEVFAKGDGRWAGIKRVLVFEFHNRPDGVRFGLQIGPGDVEFRERLLQFAVAHEPPFGASSRRLNDQWNQIWSRPFLSGLAALSTDAIRTQLSIAWNQFVVSELPAIHELVLEFVITERKRPAVGEQR